MPRDWWNPKEAAGASKDRKAAGKAIKRKKAGKAKKSAHKKLAAAPRPAPVPATDNFGRTMQWRQVRYLALRNSGGCNCCGARAEDGVQLHVDHIKPRSQFPELALSLDNLQVLCDDCNIGKGSWDYTDWR